MGLAVSWPKCLDKAEHKVLGEFIGEQTYISETKEGFLEEISY